ncbi:zinc metalloprotease, partial [Haematococcus lacustris]
MAYKAATWLRPCCCCGVDEQAGTVGKAQTALLPGVRVSEVAAASAAGRAGLRDGDIITAINGSKLPASPDSVSQ